MCTATPSTQAKQSPPVFYLPVHPAQRAVSLAPSVSGTPGVDPAICSQQQEQWEPVPTLPEIVPLQGIFTAPPGTLPSVATAETRARLTDGNKLQLVRLCVAHGEEYLGPKEEYWLKRTVQFNRMKGTNMANARTVVTALLKKYKMEMNLDEKSSRNVHADTDMNQALYLWCTWVEWADATKDSVRAAATSAKDVQAHKTKMDQENMLLPQSKKRIFVEAAAGMGDETDNEDIGWMGSGQGESVPMTKGQEAQLRRDKKRKLKDRKENLDKIYTMKEQDMTSVMKNVAEYLMNREALQGQAASLAVSGSATDDKRYERYGRRYEGQIPRLKGYSSPPMRIPVN
ncbi:hypothetical protein K440DRAFT_640202 [Wilcoxina mikolae CBS 423.85]|nr:hypothetical protein K440DRAFT_640202 [Wilcoxina mikolae CBS 423.85]